MIMPSQIASISVVLAFCGYAFAGGIVSAQEPSVDAQGGESDRAIAAAAQARTRSSDDSEMTLRAKRAATTVQSEAFRALMEDMSPGLMTALGVGDEAGIDMDLSAPQQLHQAPIALVFASSSIPLPTLRRYAADLERTGGAMALRGGVGGLKELGPTVDFIMKVLKTKPDCNGPECDMREVRVIIDPILFGHAGVDRVPAVSVVEHDLFASYCARQSETARETAWRISYGDASLEGHLEALAKTAEPGAGAVLAKLRGESH